MLNFFVPEPWKFERNKKYRADVQNGYSAPNGSLSRPNYSTHGESMNLNELTGDQRHELRGHLGTLCPQAILRNDDGQSRTARRQSDSDPDDSTMIQRRK